MSADDEDLVWLHNRAVPRAYYEYVKALAGEAPPLSVEQREQLRVLLRPSTTKPRLTNQIRHRNGEPVNAGHHVDELPDPPRRNRGRHRRQPHRTEREPL